MALCIATWAIPTPDNAACSEASGADKVSTAGVGSKLMMLPSWFKSPNVDFTAEKSARY
ncbi:hypothetical protein ACFSJQ_22090 [Vibrio olivae]